MAQVSPEEIERMRAQLLAQQELERARVTLVTAQQEEQELGRAREQLTAIQRKREEAQRIANQQQQNDGQNGHSPEPVQPGRRDNNVSAQNSDIYNLVSAMSFSQLEYKIVKFSDENEIHPLEFLEKLEKFF